MGEKTRGGVVPGYHPSLDTGPPEKQTLKKMGWYHKPAWRRARLLALQRDRFLCQLRLSEKCTGVATEVHHVVELERAPELGLELSNLESCCWWCHEETKRRPSSRAASRPGVRVIVMGGAGDDAARG